MIAIAQSLMAQVFHIFQVNLPRFSTDRQKATFERTLVALKVSQSFPILILKSRLLLIQVVRGIAHGFAGFFRASISLILINPWCRILCNPGVPFWMFPLRNVPRCKCIAWFRFASWSCIEFLCVPRRPCHGLWQHPVCRVPHHPSGLGPPMILTFARAICLSWIKKSANLHVHQNSCPS